MVLLQEGRWSVVVAFLRVEFGVHDWKTYFGFGRDFAEEIVAIFMIPRARFRLSHLLNSLMEPRTFQLGRLDLGLLVRA